MVLVGWMVDIAIFKTVLPGLVTMKANTALAFLLSGVSLWLLHNESERRSHRGERQNNHFILPPLSSIFSRRAIAQGCAFTVAMIGLLTLSQYLFNWNLGIDQLVFREMAGAVGTSHPGRMAPNTALNFLLIGFALLLLHRRTRRNHWLVQFLTLTAAWVSLPGLIGYVYGVKSLYGIASYTQMALHTVLTFIVLCIGILLTHPDQGLMRIVTSNSTGGFIARRLLVAAIAFPSGLGWLILQGYRAGLYNTAFGLALLVMVSIVVFAVWIWQNAQTLDRIDNERSWAQQALRESEERYRAFIEQSSERIWRFELEQPLSTDCPEDEQIQHFYQYGYLAECNKVMAQMYGFSEAQEIVGIRLANFLVPSDPHNIEYLRSFIRSSYRLNDAESHAVDKHGLAKYFLNNLVGIVENGLLVRAWGSQRDITDRKRAEEALQETNQTLQALIQASPLAIITVNADGNLKMWSPAAERIFGWTEQEVLDRPVPFVPEDKQEEFRRLHQVKLEGNSLTGLEVRRQKKDGSPIDIAFWGAPLQDAKGNIYSTMALIADISDRKRTQEALRESEERFRRLIESNIFGVAFGNFSGEIHYANDYFLKMVRYEREELMQGQLSWTQMTPPEFLHLDARATEELKTYGVATPFEKEYIRKDGTRVPILIGRALLKEPYDQQQEMVVFYLDLTERKQAESALRESEERFRKFFEEAPIGISVIDLDGRFLKVNKTYCEMLGYLEPELDQLTFAAITHPEDVHKDLRYTEQLFKAEIGSYQSEKRYIKKNGEILWVNLTATAIFDQDGKARYGLGMVEDITDRKRTQEERELLLAREQAARAEAEAANRMKDEFLATLSHELRTPLNAMLGWTQMLRTRKLDEAKAARALETIDRNTKSLSQLIEDVLDVSRIITGKLHLNVRPVELVPVIEAALETVLPAANAKDIGIEARLDPSSGTVLGDANRLQQVVWNLLSNAVKFTPKGGRVEVRLELIDSRVQIRVSDTGQGISPEFLPYVFERFRQADSTTTRSHGGLGLGLAIVRHLVELQGGTVHVQSPGIGQGATFIVNLPIRAIRLTASEPASVQPMLRNEVPTLSPAILNGLRVLVVDDEADARELLTTLLGQYGAEVIAVATASEALETLQRLKPNVLVSDIAMPGEDGYALIRKVRLLDAEQGGQIPAVALTAYARAEDRINALRAGFQLHIAKPVNPEELAAVVANLAGRAEK